MNRDEKRAQALNDTDFATAVVKHAFAGEYATTQTKDRVSDVLARIQVDLISPLDRRVASLEQQVTELKATVAALRNAEGRRME